MVPRRSSRLTTGTRTGRVLDAATAVWMDLDIRREERWLAGAIGPEYERYRAAVPRHLAVSSLSRLPRRPT
jgi:hypothetical protein